MSDRQAWLEGRASGIGGSDAAAAVGICPWKTQYELYLEKTEPVVDRGQTDGMIWGSLLEPAIRQRYCDVTGNTVTVPDGQLRHPEHPWMIANLDGMVSSQKLYEGKTYWSSENWGPDGSNEIPEQYLLQVQHYMAVTGAQSTDVAVLIAGSDFRILNVEADREVQSLLIEREREFWHNHVVPRIPPDPTTQEDVKQMFRRSLGDMVEADESIHKLWIQLRDARQRIKDAEEIKEACEIAIKKAIGHHDGIEFQGQPLATWKSAADSIKFDVDQFKSEHPALFQQYQRVVDGSRRFLCKEPKKVKAK